MGVFGLLSRCLQNQGECVDFVDLVTVAADINGIEILVDFYSFEHFLMRKCWTALSTTHNNPYLRICGGEYASMDAYIRKVICDLQSLNIHLVFYIDGAKGSSTLTIEHKLSTWRKRHYNDVRKLSEILGVCEGHLDINKLPETTSVRPVLLETQFLQTLNSCNCVIHQCAAGEADYRLASDLIQRPRAFAVLSNDSDFCIMKDGYFIPNDLFDVNNDLDLGVSHTPSKPLCLTVGVISSRKVAMLLELTSHDMLVDFAILAGNDFTSPYVSRLYNSLGIDRKNLSSVARMISEYGSLENNQFIQQQMKQNTDLRNSVCMSRKFYKLTLSVEDEINDKGPLSLYIKSTVERGLLPASVMAMNNNFYWHRMILEDCSEGHPCIEVALAPLRSYVYAIVLQYGEDYVEEFGRGPWKTLHSTKVYSAKDRSGHTPTADHIVPEKFSDNIKMFKKVITHLERGFCVNYFAKYGKKIGFICYILRHFLVMNSRGNLQINIQEFLSLVAATLSTEHPREFYLALAIRPSVRCITIGNWLQDIYRHAFCFLGNLLHVSGEFPSARELFSGSRWAAFYMCYDSKSVPYLSQHTVKEVISHRQLVIQQFHDVIQDICQG